MIPLPTKKRLRRKVDEEYAHLHSIIGCCTVHQVEDSMRKIHGLLLKIKAYGFTPQKETTEIFED